jgi:hypothetical protein
LGDEPGEGGGLDALVDVGAGDELGRRLGRLADVGGDRGLLHGHPEHGQAGVGGVEAGLLLGGLGLEGADLGLGVGERLGGAAGALTCRGEVGGIAARIGGDRHEGACREDRGEKDTRHPHGRGTVASTRRSLRSRDAPAGRLRAFTAAAAGSPGGASPSPI